MSKKGLDSLGYMSNSFQTFTPWTILGIHLFVVWFYQLSLWDLLSLCQHTQAYSQSTWNTNRFQMPPSCPWKQNKHTIEQRTTQKSDSPSTNYLLLWVDECFNVRWEECFEWMLDRCILCCDLLCLQLLNESFLLC